MRSKKAPPISTLLKSKIQNPKSIQAVIFDIGKVLIDFNFDLAFEAASRCVNLPPAEIRRRLFGSGEISGTGKILDFVEFECGRITEREFHRRVEMMLGHALPYDAFHALWNGIFLAEIAPTIGLLEKLRRQPGITIGILSNTNVLHYEFLRRRMNVLSRLEHVYVSHEMGCRKPEPASYQYVLKKMKVAPHQALFIDDLQDNVAAAGALGMQTIHATHPEAVREGLMLMGLV